MARSRSYGDILRDARERKHMDVYTAARRLRIRPDILRAIEDADFSRMPPRGYTRNMISAYARLVGLDPHEITNRYLDEIHLFETGRSRSEDAGSRNRRTARGGRGETAGGPDSRRRPRGMREDRPGRFEDARQPRRGAGLASAREPRPRRGEPRQGFVNGTSFPNLYSGGSQNAARQSTGGASPRLVFVIGGIIIALVVIIVLVVVFGGNKQQPAEVPNVPISGLTDTSTPADSSSSFAATAETAPTSVTVEYKVADGQEAYAVIDNDGDSSSEMLTGPVSETVEVSGTWTFATWADDAVTITVNGEKVAFEDETSSGMPMCTVDFDAYLEQWYKDHPNAQRSSASSSASSSADDDANQDDEDGSSSRSSSSKSSKSDDTSDE